MERAKRAAWQALVLLVSVVAALPGASAQTGPSTGPSSGSTAYDRLDLTTPEAALRQFLGAYRRGDYVTAFWILAPASQQAFQVHLMRFDLSRIARVSVTGAMTHAPEMIRRSTGWSRPIRASRSPMRCRSRAGSTSCR